VRTADFHYDLPFERIAQHPLKERDQSRLLVLRRQKYLLEHKRFTALPDYFAPGDVLVINNSKVVPARLRALKRETGARIEIFLVEEIGPNRWWCLLKPGKRVQMGTSLELLDKQKKGSGILATVEEKNEEGHYLIQFSGTPEIRGELENLGEVPLPPYIERHREESEDRERYQTVFAQREGSVAAPTAGLHFTPQILDKIRAAGATIVEVTLHVGLGTFAPVKAESLEEHKMHLEHYEFPESAAAAIRDCKRKGRRVFAAGTTSLRVLETVAREGREIAGKRGSTRLFLYPPAEFRVVDALLTNFHLPESTLLMLVSAFAAPGSMDGRERVLAAYAEAIRAEYRFFSYGDAMLIL
jgi:S-adenosylmethionine:tRNA ribosyltransferase-isomerase